MKSVRVPDDLLQFARRLSDAGHGAYLVGGAVRDALLGRPAGDFDIATDATPEQVQALFRRVIPTGIQHGTVTVLLPAHKVEVTTFRTEHGYSDGRRPDRVEYASRIEDDLSRRDFTINAMAWDILGRRLVDPWDGRGDLSRRIVRAVGDPALRFAEDGLRVLRALRFASQLEFEMDGPTLDAIPGALERFRLVSAERVRDETSKILLSPRPSVGLALMERTGMLAIVFPELAACRGETQKGAHLLDVLDHLYAATDAAPPELRLRLAALFHDAGKPGSRGIGADGEATFHRHEELSARIARDTMRRLRYPNDLSDAVEHLVRQHMFNYEDRWTDAAVRRFAARVGRSSLDDLIALRRADAVATAGQPADTRALAAFRDRIDAVLARGAALNLKDLAIGGEDLAALGVPRGPAMGELLKELLETVLEDPAQNGRESLLRIAAALWNRKKPTRT